MLSSLFKKFRFQSEIPKPYDYQKVTAGHYDFQSSPHSVRGLWHRKKFNVFSEFLSNPKQTCVIDLGCGPGVFLRDFCNSIPIAIGYDIAINQVTYAKTFSGPNRIFISTFEELFLVLDERRAELQNSEVTITSIELIEHIEKDEFVVLVTELRNRLYAIGVRNVNLLVSTPNKMSMWPILERFIDLILGTDYHIQHTNIMNSKTFEKLLLELNPKNLSICSYMSVNHWLIKRERVRPYKVLTSRGMLLLGIAIL
jgi:SAM-dependent methyltransferase